VTVYRSDGALDPTFSGNGKVATNPTNDVDRAYAVTTQDGEEWLSEDGRSGRRPRWLRGGVIGDSSGSRAVAAPEPRQGRRIPSTKRED
jgi:hypothetical protein